MNPEQKRKFDSLIRHGMKLANDAVENVNHPGRLNWVNRELEKTTLALKVLLKEAGLLK